MRRIQWVTAMLVVCVAGGAALADGGEPADTGTVIARVAALEDARRAAMVAADTTALRAAMSRDATYVHSNGLAQSREELCAVLARGDIRYRSFAIEGVAYRAYGATVIGTGVQRLELESSGRPLTSRSRFTVVYVLDGTAPRLAAYQSTTLPEVVPRAKP